MTNSSLALSFPLSISLLLLLLQLYACTPTELEAPKPSCTSDLSLRIDALRESPCGTNQGSFAVIASGGDGQYEYQLNHGSFVSYNSFKGLEPGLHHLLVRDGLDCEAEIEVLIPSGLLLADVQPILEANCAVSGCHVGSNAARVNLKDVNNIIARAEDIKDRTMASNMPPSNSGYALTAEEIELLTCWVNDGAKE